MNAALKPLLGLILLVQCQAQEQGWVSFVNAGATDRDKVWLNAVGQENGGVLAPAGNLFRVGLFYNPGGTMDESQFIQLGDAVFIGPSPGVFLGGARSIPLHGPDVPEYFQIRGWEAAYGVAYEEFIANAASPAYFGKSTVFHIEPWCCNQGGPYPSVLDASNPGWHGFALTPIPEPAPVTLLVFGLFLLGRKVLGGRDK